jgi:hypothetical protein
LTRSAVTNLAHPPIHTHELGERPHRHSGNVTHDSTNTQRSKRFTRVHLPVVTTPNTHTQGSTSVALHAAFPDVVETPHGRTERTPIPTPTHPPSHTPYIPVHLIHLGLPLSPDERVRVFGHRLAHTVHRPPLYPSQIQSQCQNEGPTTATYKVGSPKREIG